MSIKILDREGTFTSSPIYYAYKVVKLFEKDKRTEETIFRVLTLLKSEAPNVSSKQLFYGLIFLHMNGIIDMDSGVIRLRHENTTG